MGADIDEQPPIAIEHELLERVRALVEPGAVGQRDAAARHVTNDGLDRAARIVRERIEAEDGLGGRSIELLVRADHEAERIFDPGQELLEPLAAGGVGIEQQQPAIRVTPAAHVGNHEQVPAGHLDNRPRKFQMVLFAGDESSTKAGLHVDLDFWKGEIAAAAGLRSHRIAAFPHGIGGGQRAKAEQDRREGDDTHAQASASNLKCEMIHSGLPDFRSKVVPCSPGAVQLNITRL